MRYFSDQRVIFAVTAYLPRLSRETVPSLADNNTVLPLPI